jgi:hypothetical protein
VPGLIEIEMLGSHRVLDEASLQDLLCRLQEEFSWPTRADRFFLENKWRRRWGDLYRCRGAGGSPDVVLKVHRNWSDPSDTPHVLYEQMNRLAGGRWPKSAGFMRAIAWAGSPPVLCMPYVEGADLSAALQSPKGLERVGRRPAEVIRCCGEVLGAYHSRSGETGDLERFALDDPRTARLIDSQLRRMGRGQGSGLSGEEPVVVVPLHGDFGLQNVRLAPDGKLWFLDPPAYPLKGLINDDVARFILQLRARLRLQRATTEGRPDAASLAEAFLEGYAETGPVDVRLPAQRWLIRLFQGSRARGLAAGRARRGRFLEASWYGTIWAKDLIGLRF